MALDPDDYKHMLVFRFKEARDAAGLTQDQAAEGLRCAQSEISKIETGEREVDLFRAIELAALYRTSLAEIIRAIRDSRVADAEDRAWLNRGFFGAE